MNTFESSIPAWFVPRVVPYGTAPEYIKEQWVDVPLPVRSLGDTESPNITFGHDLGSIFSVVVREGVTVNAGDAIKALRLFDREEAADFWADYLHPSQELNFGVDEGQVYPASDIQRILPGIELFDTIE